MLVNFLTLSVQLFKMLFVLIDYHIACILKYNVF